ncbi:MAG: exo-alpha-sialidase [Thermoplasmatota archaeon]
MKQISRTHILGAVLIAALLTVPVNIAMGDAGTDKNTPLPAFSTGAPDNPQVATGPICRAKPVEATVVQPTVLNENGDVQITSETTDQLHPASVASSNGDIMAMYENYESLMTGDIGIATSTDGQTWTSAGTIQVPDYRERYPALDIVRGNKGIGTFASDPRDTVFYYLDMADVGDVGSMNISGYDWGSSGYTNPQMASVAGYGLSEKPTAYFNGLFSYNVDVATSSAEEDHSFTYQFYAQDEGYAQLIYWHGFGDDLYNISADIDQKTGHAYWVMEGYNETNPENFRVRMFSCYIDPELGGDWWNTDYNFGYINDSIHPDVSAAGGITYLAVEHIEGGFNHNILCYLSTDDGATWEAVEVAATMDQETDPTIVAYPGGSASCVYTKNGDLYVSHTTDAGATWSDPEQLSESGAVRPGFGSADISSGGHVVWQDDQNGNADIYYDNAGVPGPLLSIIDVSGGFGITATVANSGTQAAEDVEYTISFDALIGGTEKTGTVTVPVDGEVEVKSGFIVGLGPADISVEVGGVSASASGFVLGPFVLGL